MAATSVLAGTSLECLNWIFGVETDEDLVSRMAWIGFWYTTIVGFYSILQPAPYGRYATASSIPTVNAKLGWMLQESPMVFGIVILYFVTPAGNLNNLHNIVPLVLILIHYVNRSFIYPLKLKDAKPVPITTMLGAFVFTSFNGILQGHHLMNVRDISGSSSVLLLLGTIIFFAGMGINVYHDELLSSMRKSAKESGSKSYVIPRGGLFNFISGANYFGEILEWWGVALITLQNPQILFAVFTLLFLGLRAKHHHEFYKRTFGNTYPSNRKAVIPFIF